MDTNAFEFKKNDKREIYYFESSYFAKHDELCPGTGECWLKSENQNDNLTYSYKKFYGGVLFTIENNDTIQTHLYKYYKKIIKENKDTIHVSLKEFNNHLNILLIISSREILSIYIFMIIKDGLMFL